MTCRHLAERLAVVGHVGEDHQDVPALDEGQILGCGEGVSRGEQALRARLVCVVQEHHRVGQGSARFHGVAKCPGRVVGNSDPGEHDGKLTLGFAPQSGMARDAKGQPVVGKAARAEQWQLLSPDQAVHEIDGGNAGFDEVPGQIPSRRVDGQPVDPKDAFRCHRRAAVHGPADAIEHPTQQVPSDPELQWMSPHPNPGPFEPEAGGGSQDFDHHPIRVDGRHPTDPRRAVGADDVDPFLEPHLHMPLHEQQWTFDAPGRPFDRNVRAHATSPSRAAKSRSSSA